MIREQEDNRSVAHLYCINTDGQNTNTMKLFLDDFRNPQDCLGYVSRYGIRPDTYLGEWRVVRSYDEFVRVISAGFMEMPTEISFDHDLADEHYNTEKMYDDSGAYNELYASFKEKTGYDAAKYLVSFCEKNKLPLPKCYCHSMNPVGRENIRSLLKC